jgi:hypothetical protein
MALFFAFFAESSMIRGDYSDVVGKKAYRVASRLFRSHRSILYDNSYWGERFARSKTSPVDWETVPDGLVH